MEAPYTGLPSILLTSALLIFTSALLLNAYQDVSDYIIFFVISTGIVLALLSVGREIEVSEGKIIVSYGFPKGLFKMVFTDVVHVVNLTDLEKGRLFRYFKVQLIPYSCMIVYPLLYIIIKASLPPLRYLTLISIPVCVGVALITYLMLTSSSYKKFVKYAGYMLSIVFIILDFFIANYYRQVFNRSILSDINTLLPLMVGQVLAFLFFMPLAAIERHTIVLEDVDGKKCAIIVANEEDARSLIRTIMREVMIHA